MKHEDGVAFALQALTEILCGPGARIPSPPIKRLGNI